MRDQLNLGRGPRALLSCAAVLAIGGGLLTVPASADPYPPESVSLAKYVARRGSHDSVLIGEGPAGITVIVSIKNKGHNVRLGKAVTGSSGNARVSFVLPKRLTLGVHTLEVKTKPAKKGMIVKLPLMVKRAK